jgi:glycine/D-amino acid oxidase-like deaminating enzyme
MVKTQQIAVIGAGAFGGWTALAMLRLGARVTLVDAWGPANSRASSGGETRLIRAIYGPDLVYTRMAARALELWKENEANWGRQLFHPTGLVWMSAGADDSYERAALENLGRCGVAHELMETSEAATRFPQINFEGVRSVIYERDAGYLAARIACQSVLDSFIAEGGEYRQAQAEPGPTQGNRMGAVRLSDGTILQRDHYCFACGPWLGRMFPEHIGNLVSATRQEVFFFGTEAGGKEFDEGPMPAWVDHGRGFNYGMPGNLGRGFKFADDARGPAIDPTSGERVISDEGLRSAREYLGFRFPRLAGAPVVDARVCQYEDTPDHHFIIDSLPGADNAWILGGGSGHGFKHGPVVGKLAARMVIEGAAPEPQFRLSRFAEGAV